MPKEFAIGIPADRTIHKIPKQETPETWGISIQKHITPKGSGERTHYDLRLNPPGSNKAYSFALPKAKLPNFGEKILAVETFTHTKDYMPFQGVISSGYGRGVVSRELLDSTEVVGAGPDKIVFNLYNEKTPNQYSMVRISGNNWLLSNITVTDKNKNFDVPFAKPKLKEVPFDKINFEKALKDYTLMLKLDGAFSTIQFRDGKAKAFSHRKPKKSSYKSGIIEYTYKLPELQKARIPKELSNTDIQAEIVARKRGKALPYAVVGGMLNSKVLKSREEQKLKGKLEPWAFNITKYKGKSVNDMAFEEKLKLLKEISKKVPTINIVPTATTESKKRRLLKKLIAGKHPLSSEGVVFRDEKNLFKSKIRPTQDVYIRDMVEGKGKYKNKLGAIRYSLSPKGPIVGNIGTGFSDKTRKDLWDNKDRYINSTIEVTSRGSYRKNGPLREPSFERIHWEKSFR